MVKNDLEVIDALKIDQVAYYPLLASKLKKHEITEALGIVDYRKGKQLYHIIRKNLSREYHQTSAWSFSRTPGLIDEYIVDYREYAGLGSGSFGYLKGTLYSNTFSVPDYILRVESGALPLAGKRVFSLKEKLQYDLLMSFFSGSLSLDRLEKNYGRPGIRAIRPALLALSLAGAVRKEGINMITTEKGNYYFIILMREFFNGVNTLREQRLSRDGL
jgi:coproporphyrinogen III oxidase-like Fe-S oxidoreductase